MPNIFLLQFLPCAGFTLLFVTDDCKMKLEDKLIELESYCRVFTALEIFMREQNLKKWKIVTFLTETYP